MIERFGAYPEDWRTPVCGAYVIKHPVTGRFYAGSSDNLYQRRSEHLSALRRGCHENWQLQKAFDDHPAVEFLAEQTTDIEQALNLEQQVINLYRDTGLLFNLATDVRLSFLGRNHTEESKRRISESKQGQGAGVAKSLEHRAKIGAANKGKPGASAETLAKIVAVRSRAIVIDGVRYSSLSEAARAFNVTVTTVYDRIRSTSERFSGWRYE